MLFAVRRVHKASCRSADSVPVPRRHREQDSAAAMRPRVSRATCAESLYRRTGRAHSLAGARHERSVQRTLGGAVSRETSAQARWRFLSGGHSGPSRIPCIPGRTRALPVRSTFHAKPARCGCVHQRVSISLRELPEERRVGVRGGRDPGREGAGGFILGPADTAHARGAQHRRVGESRSTSTSPWRRSPPHGRVMWSTAGAREQFAQCA